MARITDRHTFGWLNEQMLKGRMEAVLGESLTKTEGRYDTFDFTSESYRVELKCRRKKYNRSQFETWLIPVCKVRPQEADPQGKLKEANVIFYYWEEDDSLWKLVLDGNSLDEIEVSCPFFNPHQPHYWFPSSWFKQIEKPSPSLQHQESTPN